MVFDLVLLENWVREAVYDPSGIDFLYWHHVIDVIVTAGGEGANDRRRFPNMDKNVGPGDQADIRPGLVGKPLGPDNFPMVSPNGRRLFKDRGLARGEGTDLAEAVFVLPKEVIDFGSPTIGRHAERPDLEANLPLTEQDLRRRLALPRRQLLIWTYSGPNGNSRFLLASPLTGIATDCRHGPTCTILALPEMQGNVSGVYRLRFETWERPLDYPATSLDRDAGLYVSAGALTQGGQIGDIVKDVPALISNRWTMRNEPNPDTYLNTTVIEGTAVFRMDVLQVRRTTPDQLRGQFLHPLASGYLRMPPDVEVSPGGDGVRYTVVDHQVMTNFPAGQRYGLIRIDIEQAAQFHNPSDIQWR